MFIHPNYIKTASAALGLSLIGVSVYAQTPSHDVLSLSQPDIGQISAVSTKMSFAELEAKLRLHPALDALDLFVLADRERAEGALGLPDPVISIGLNNFPVFSPSFTEYLPTNKSVGVRQSIPNVAKRRAKSLKSIRSAAQTELEQEMQFSILRSELIRLLIEKEKITKLRALAFARQDKYQELTDIIEIEVNAGRPIVFRLAEIDVERTEVARTLSELDGQESELDAQFIDLLGVVPNTPAPSQSVTPWSGNALAFYAVRVADAVVNIENAEVQKAEADFKPDWGLNFTYQQRESGSGAPGSNFDGDDWISGGVSFTVPLWADKRQKPNLRAAKNVREAARARRMAVSRRALSDWKRSQARHDVAVRNIDILSEKIEAIKQQISSTLITYETGAGDYAPIVDGEISILMLRAQIEMETALRDGAIAQMNSFLVGMK